MLLNVCTNFEISHAFAFFFFSAKNLAKIRPILCKQFRNFAKKYICINIFLENRALVLCIYFSSISSGRATELSHPHPSVKSRDREIQRTYLPVTGSSRRYNERSCTVTYEKGVCTKRGEGYTWSICRLVDHENQATAQSPATRGIHAFFALRVSPQLHQFPESCESSARSSLSSTHRERIF